MTVQRYAILEYLVRNAVHATADEILVAVNHADPRASRATIYNSLRALARAGLVREVAADGKAARYDASLHRHHHFICECCGAIEDVPWFDLPSEAAQAALDGRKARRYEIVFRGRCSTCGD